MNTYKTDDAGVIARGLVTRGFTVTGYAFESGEIVCSKHAVGSVETNAPKEVFEAVVTTYANRNAVAAKKK